jgi:hypothetical protein
MENWKVIRLADAGQVNCWRRARFELLPVEQYHVIGNDVEIGIKPLGEIFKRALTIKANMGQITNVVPLTKGVSIFHLLGHDTQPATLF